MCFVLVDQFHLWRKQLSIAWQKHEATKKIQVASLKEKLHIQRNICSGLEHKPRTTAFFEGSSCSTNQTDQEALCHFEVAANLPSQMNRLPHLLGFCRSHLANERSCIISQLWHLGSPFNITSLQLERMQNVTITSLHIFVNHFANTINKELKKVNTFGWLQKRHRLHLVNKRTRRIQLRHVVHSNLKITNTHQTNCQT